MYTIQIVPGRTIRSDYFTTYLGDEKNIFRARFNFLNTDQSVKIELIAKRRWYKKSKENSGFFNYQEKDRKILAVDPAISTDNLEVKPENILAFSLLEKNHSNDVGKESADSQVLISDANDETYNISVYPNPANKSITMRWSSLDFIADKVELLDLTGHVITTEIPNRPGAFEMDVSSLTSGVYMITITKDAKITTTKLMIKR